MIEGECLSCEIAACNERSEGRGRRDDEHLWSASSKVGNLIRRACLAECAAIVPCILGVTGLHRLPYSGR